MKHMDILLSVLRTPLFEEHNHAFHHVSHHVKQLNHSVIFFFSSVIVACVFSAGMVSP